MTPEHSDSKDECYFCYLDSWLNSAPKCALYRFPGPKQLSMRLVPRSSAELVPSHLGWKSSGEGWLCIFVGIPPTRGGEEHPRD